ncbi:glycosyltransferase [Adonisia turfae]|uniref:Glycosyltransferase n=1 Tax=Adonisia turfae CCMR0081 TaxID=2292702 RepID=A0A6M0RUW3_9CYAN|nr:glycosyltransferase [Adonisia turfae]NEZ59936.1 glycosyltransferase [Adonisia turfae CCMR0081]
MSYFENKRIAILFANYGPYHLSRLEGFFKLCKKIRWEVIPLELTRSGISYEWKTQINNNSTPILSVLGERSLEQVSFHDLLRKLFLNLHKIQPDIVAIAGYSRPSIFAVFLWCKLHKVSTILLSESKEDDFIRNCFSEKLKSLIVSNYDAALVGGSPHKRYLIKLGMKPEAISFGYNVVGNEVFQNGKENFEKPIEKPYFLAINRFIPKKNLFFILESYARYRLTATNYAWDLVLCGSGQLLSEIELTIKRLNIGDHVHLPGFLQQSQLLPYFAHASCFIHGSLQEQWGLVVNEAMAAGLPVLVSNRCGCFEDLVIEGVNGFGFDPENSKELTDLMLKISSTSIDLKSMREASLAHISKYSPGYFAQGLKQAVNYALSTN